MSECSFCKKIFSTNSNLTKHVHICKSKDKILLESQLQTQREQLESQLQTQQEQYESQLQTQKEQYETQLQTQQEQHESQLQIQLQTLREQYESQLQTQREKFHNLLEHQREQICSLKEQLGEFKTQIFEIAKQPKESHVHHTTKTTHNEKTLNIINQLAPMDFENAQAEIEEIIKTHFTEEVFLGGPTAIARMIVQYLLMDEESNKYRLVCVDSSRKNFKYVDAKTKQLMIDHGFQRFHEYLKSPSERANYLAFIKSFEKNNFQNDKYFYGIRERNEEFIQSRNLLSDKIISEITK